MGAAYQEINELPMNGENDRLGLSKKTLDYEEAKDEETKLVE
ncbi:MULTISPECIES: hypothetical protein [Bacillus]|nr:hypothetical protein [Bacillus zhangzhouensis]